MTNKITWSAAPVDRSGSTGGGLTTELNSIANGAYGAGGLFDNTSNLDQYAEIHIHLASLSPAAGAYLQVFLQQEIAATQEQVPSSTNPAQHQAVAFVSIDTTATAAKEAATPLFKIPPGKFSIVILNATGVALAASGNTAKMYTTDDMIN